MVAVIKLEVHPTRSLHLSLQVPAKFWPRRTRQLRGAPSSLTENTGSVGPDHPAVHPGPAVREMITRSKSRQQKNNHNESAQTLSPILDAIVLFGSEAKKLQNSDPQNEAMQLKGKLSGAIDRYDYDAVCEILMKMPADSEIRQDILDYCLFSLFTRPKRTRRASGQETVYFWAQNKNVDLNEDRGFHLLELIVAAGANPRIADNDGLTVLHWLAQRSEDAGVISKIVGVLIGAGCDIEARDGVYGATPLGWSAWFG